MADDPEGAPAEAPHISVYGRHRGMEPLLPLILKEGFQELTAPQLPISRIVPVVAHAVAVFGDEHKASHWLSTPLALLENRAPSELLHSTEGIQRVEVILTRIEHNIFS